MKHPKITQIEVVVSGGRERSQWPETVEIFALTDDGKLFSSAYSGPGTEMNWRPIPTPDPGPLVICGKCCARVSLTEAVCPECGELFDPLTTRPATP